MQEITIRVKKGGKIDLGVTGAKGQTCRDLTKLIEKALGTTMETKNTTEYYEQEQHSQNEQALGGSFCDKSW